MLAYVDMNQFRLQIAIQLFNGYLSLHPASDSLRVLTQYVENMTDLVQDCISNPTTSVVVTHRNIDITRIHISRCRQVPPDRQEKKKQKTGGKKEPVHIAIFCIIYCATNNLLTVSSCSSYRQKRFYCSDDILNVYFCFNGLLDVLDQYLCEQNQNRKRSLILNLYTNSHFALKFRERTRTLKDHVATNTFNFFDIDKIIIPAHHNLHYTMYVVFMESKDIVFYDTLNLMPPKALSFEDVLSYIEDESREANVPFERDSWLFVTAKVVQQGNGLDCGYCVIKNAMLVLQDLPLDLNVSKCSLNIITFKVLLSSLT